VQADRLPLVLASLFVPTLLPEPSFDSRAVDSSFAELPPKAGVVQETCVMGSSNVSDNHTWNEYGE
jgi:hypothetical protein